MFDFDVRSGQDPQPESSLREPWRSPPETESPFFQPLSRMPRRRPVMVPPTVSVGEALAWMTEHRAAAALVASHGVLLGLLREEDVLKGLVDDEDGALLPVWRVMSPAGETLLETDTVAYAIRKLWSGEGRAMAIVEPTGGPLGVLEIQDVMAWMCGRVGAGPRLGDTPPRRV